MLHWLYCGVGEESFVSARRLMYTYCGGGRSCVANMKRSLLCHQYIRTVAHIRKGADLCSILSLVLRPMMPPSPQIPCPSCPWLPSRTCPRNSFLVSDPHPTPILAPTSIPVLSLSLFVSRLGLLGLSFREGKV